MGQTLEKMNQQAKGELLHDKVINGDIESIKALCRHGVNIECIDKNGKTPLIVACMSPLLFNAAQTLIELGANINAYRPGRHKGTPLHHAAKRGLEQTVGLLLCHRANALVRNDDCQTPLDVARIKGFTNVVRLIENHICYYSGWLRELHFPGFLEVFAPQLLSRKIWAVVIPCGSSNSTKPLRLELAIYSSLQDAQPRTVIALSKSKIEEHQFHQPDPVLVIFDQPAKTRYKLASADQGDKQQLHLLYNACRGIPRVNGTSMSDPVTEQTASEAAELAMAISASIQSAAGNRPVPVPNTQSSSEANHTNGWGSSVDNASHNGCGPSVGPTHSEASSSGYINEPTKDEYNGWGVFGSEQNSNHSGDRRGEKDPVLQTTAASTASPSTTPSAPPVPEGILDEGPVLYPSIDLSPMETPVPDSTSNAKYEESSCVICWEAPIEGACIPCGHMAGCMSCLNEIKASKGVCPVCRAKMVQVIRLYSV